MSVRKTSFDSQRCSFCRCSEDNEIKFGPIYKYRDIITHYFCLLLSSNIMQKGKDKEGILGFLLVDIRKELARGRRLMCCYCKKNGATLGCCDLKCKKVFHFPCALNTGSLHQFYGQFKSYCIHHRPVQRIHTAVNIKRKIDYTSAICFICYDEVDCKDTINTLWAPCCKNNAWFHRNCIQQLAMNAGYFFKCPLCNNNRKFRHEMLQHGIYIPNQDASWEMEPHAFEDLLHRYNRCDALVCLCPKGRTYTSRNAKWELVLCETCGSQGIHMACGDLKWATRVWECNECSSILSKSAKHHNTKSEIINITSRGNVDSSNESDSEISVVDQPETAVKEKLSTTHRREELDFSKKSDVITDVGDKESTDVSDNQSSPIREKDSASKETDTINLGTQITNVSSLSSETGDDVIETSKLDSENSSGNHFKVVSASVVKNDLKRAFEEIERPETSLSKRLCNSLEREMLEQNNDGIDRRSTKQIDNICPKDAHKCRHSELNSNRDVFHDGVFSEITNNPNACDKPGLIPKFVKLRDLKFQLDCSDNLQMILYDTFSVDLKMDTRVNKNHTQETSEFNLWMSKDSEKNDEEQEQKKVDYSKESKHVEDCEFKISIDLRKITALFPSDKYTTERGEG